MMNPDFQQKHVVKNLDKTESMRSSEQVLENNRLVRKSVVKEMDFKANFKDYQVSDFYLENLMAVGAEATLKSVQLSEGALDMADNVGIQAAAIADYIETNNEQTNNEGE